MTLFSKEDDRKYGGWILLGVGVLLFLIFVLLAAMYLISHEHVQAAASHIEAAKAQGIAEILDFDRDDVTLSLIVMMGLALTVGLMLILGIAYKLMDVADRTMPLALPEGSIRALLAFSLVLIFVCLSAFLFSAVEGKQCKDCGVNLTRITAAQLADLQTNFVVASEEAKDASGNTVYQQVADPENKGQTKNDLTHPLYNAIYYPKLSKDAADFSKQIFTTLATIFVSVVSFYFGSSVTSSAVKTGTAAAQLGTDGDKLKNALLDANSAHVTVQKAQDDLVKAATSESPDPDHVANLQKAVETAKAQQSSKQAIVGFFQK